jgi:aspartyl-tRNA(Asn)/glutamyl-tRNA(Gln) amidotransferase subunit A
MAFGDAATSTAGAASAADLDLLAAAELLRTRALSAGELLDACLRRIEERNGASSFDGAPDAVNAWARLYPELAAAQARAADTRLAREGVDAPLLCGVPIGLKDVYAVAGLPLTASSRVLAGHVADVDATVWSRLRAEGVVLIGHTHTHEFAAGGTTDQVGNPWALHRSAGGSSGGSAAALAAGMIPAALGTDTCGSLRIPSAACGTSTIKPTHGRLPLHGIIPLAPSLDHPGPMARTVADCAVLLRAMAGAGEPGERPRTGGSGSRPLAGVRIALTDRTAKVAVDTDVMDGLERARQACERLGAEVVQRPAVADLPGSDLNCIVLAEMAHYHARHTDARGRYRPSIAELLDLGSGFSSLSDYLDAQDRRAQTTAAWEDWFAEHRIDALLEPTVATPAPLRGTGYDAGKLGADGDPSIVFTATWDVTGFPVVALPAGLGDRSGLPVGVSLIAARGRDALVTRLGVALQAAELPPLH